MLQKEVFWRVSADTKTCGSPLYLSPAGGLCLPYGKQLGILTLFRTLSTKKIAKKALFLVPLPDPHEIGHCRQYFPTILRQFCLFKCAYC